MSSAPSSPHGSGSASPNSRSGDDVVYAAYFDFDHIATSSRDEESVEDGANADANDFGVVVDVAGGLPQCLEDGTVRKHGRHRVRSQPRLFHWYAEFAVKAQVIIVAVWREVC
ncbi:hypothetical protein MTO96_029033 [Rhipicephalus appendiculatus]